MRSIKNLLREIPFLGKISKLFYDWKNEYYLQNRIKRLISSGVLPYTEEAPLKYGVGHEPTIRCNLKCKMCYQGQTRALRRSELNTDEVLEMYKKLKGRASEVKLVGGEPFVRDDILDLVSFWDKNAKRVILQTNCTLVDEEIISSIKKFKNVSDIATSLDGSPEVHDVVRGIPGTFERLERAIKSIQKEMPETHITVFATLLISDNLDNFYALIDTCKKLGLGTVNVLFEQVYSKKDVEMTKNIFKNIFGWGEDDYRLNTQIRDPEFSGEVNARELAVKLREIRNYGFKRKCFVNFVPFNYYHHLDKYLNERPTKVFCLKLLSPELRINQRGDVVWCDIIEKSFGNLLNKTPDEIWLSDEYQKFRKYLFKGGLPICYRCCKASYR